MHTFTGTLNNTFPIKWSLKKTTTQTLNSLHYPVSIHIKVRLESSTRQQRRVLDASTAIMWPWTSTFWPPNLISSSLFQDAPTTQVWRKSINRYWRYRGNIKHSRVVVSVSNVSVSRPSRDVFLNVSVSSRSRHHTSRLHRLQSSNS